MFLFPCITAFIYILSLKLLTIYPTKISFLFFFIYFIRDRFPSIFNFRVIFCCVRELFVRYQNLDTK